MYYDCEEMEYGEFILIDTLYKVSVCCIGDANVNMMHVCVLPKSEPNLCNNQFDQQCPMITYTFLATKTIWETEKLFHQNLGIPNFKKSGPSGYAAAIHQWILLLFFTGDHDRLGIPYPTLIWFSLQEQHALFLGEFRFRRFHRNEKKN